MKMPAPLSSFFREFWLRLCCSLFLLLWFLIVGISRADPLDESCWRTFHLAPIGVWNGKPAGTNSVITYRSRALTQTGGVMPKNVKAGISTSMDFILSTHGSYYDYLYGSGRALEFPDYTLAECDSVVALAGSNNVTFGVHVNGMPWADSAIQSEDILHNYLEKHDGGSLLQVDRFGRIRDAALPQDPTADEQFSGAPAMEMQLTLSRNAAVVHAYVGRNCRIAMRILGWHREQHPDLISFASMSSEVAQNIHANQEYCDYSACSKQEFRDWLGGAGLYADQGQYADLSSLNSAFSDAIGFPWPSWDAVQPPTNVVWSVSTANGRWWNKWHEFRVVQVRNMVQEQIRWCIDAGWSPDLLYSHQIPINPATNDESHLKYASPWTTAFVNGGGNGITTYSANTYDTNIFNACHANDKNWGIFEYNPQDTNSVANNLSALDSVWNNNGHIICPFMWWGADDYQIYGRPLETAIAQFIYNHRNDAYTGLAKYETSPTARDVIWAMSETDDVESAMDVTSLSFANGILTGLITGQSPALSLEFNESPTRFIISDNYYAASFRLHLGNSLAGFGQVAWVDESGLTNSLAFPAKSGWNVYRINLAGNSAWREKRIKAVEFRPASVAGGNFSFDWFRLEANPCWHFDDTNEVYAVNDATNATITGGMFSGTSKTDPCFYLATDKRDPTQDADRAFIDADYFKNIRVRMTSSATSAAQLYWWKRGSPSSQFSQTTFPIQSGAQTYEINLSGDTNWRGEITRFRFDPVNASNIAFQVDCISVSPVMLPPSIANSDLIVNSLTPVFLWDAALEPNHSGITHSLELSADFSFSNIVFITNGLTGNRLVYNGTNVLDGLYWWRIRSCDATGVVSPWATPMPMFVRIWTFDREADVSSTNHLGAASTIGGIWQATASGSDPYLYFNTGSSFSRGVNADIYKRFVCRARVGVVGGSNIAQFYWFPKTGGYDFATLTLPSDGAWHDLDLDLSQYPNWKGYVDSIRLDPTLTPDTQISVDYAWLLPAVESETYTANGTPRSWLDGYGLTNDMMDADGDGMAAWKEYIAGTDPTSYGSVFRVSSSGMADIPANGFVIHWISASNRFYSIYSRSNMLEGNWSLIANNLRSTPTENVYTDIVSEAEKLRLYRLGVTNGP